MAMTFCWPCQYLQRQLGVKDIIIKSNKLAVTFWWPRQYLQTQLGVKDVISLTN